MKRFLAYHKTLSDFDKTQIYHCPNCQKKAFVKIIEDCKKISCLHCGFNKQNLGVYHIFNSKLWLSKETSFGDFWCYNYEHLEHIKLIVEAKLRERNAATDKRNKSIASRLPKWITSKENREFILKIIEQLESK